jgi:hypothetical protein
MSKERELLRQSLIALEDGPYGWELMEEIQNLLAQPEPEQEPVAWMYEWEEIGGKEWTSVKNGKYPPIVEEEYCMRNLRPLYLAPPTREPLSDKEIGEICKDHLFVASLNTFVRAIEKAHGIGVADEDN